MSTQHLPIERIAELVEGGPAPFEREHLTACVPCTSELAAYRRLVAMAHDERRRIAPPSTSWESLRGELVAEGLLTTPAARSRAATRRLWLQRAAGFALILGTGTVAGRLSAGMSVSQAVAFSAPVASESAQVVPASNTSTQFASAEEAMTQLQAAQRAYDEAAAWLSARDTMNSDGSSGQYRTRLAALDMASETFERALTDSPEDPILNQYFMATMNAREVAIRRLGTTLPVGVRVGRF